MGFGSFLTHVLSSVTHAKTRCHRPVVRAGEGELLNAPIGPVAKSVAIYLRYRIGISYRKTSELFRELFGLEFVPASALGFDRKASAQGEPIYEDLREKIRASDVLHGDEVGPLLLAEVELERADQPVPLPPWIGREVTGDPRYYNAWLARHPFSTWAE